MIVESINFKTIEIIFDNNDEHLYYGDLLKIIDDSGYGVLAQVFQINYSSNASAQNIASAKILFTIKNSTSWFNWSGNIPAKQSFIKKVQKNELLSKISTQVNDSSVNLGVLSSYNTDFKLNPSTFKSPTLVFSDDFFQKVEFTNLLTEELIKTNNKLVILDFNGEFNAGDSVEKIVAGKNFKLPLNTRGIQSLYETLISDISDETRAIIEDIFLHIEDFTSSGKNLLVSFKNFKDVIEAEYRQSRVVELALLRNKLIKLEKEGVFANKRSETTSFARYFNNNDLIIVDLSKISTLWHKYFVENIIDCNINSLQKDFFLILDSNSNNLDSNVINKLFIQGLSSGIKPITITHFESDLNKQLLSFAKNMLLFAPKVNTNEFIEFNNFLSKLGNNEVLVYGQLSKYIPLFVQVGCNTLFEENEILQNYTDITDIEVEEKQETVENQNEIVQEIAILQEPTKDENLEQQQELTQDIELEEFGQASLAEVDYYDIQPQANEDYQEILQQTSTQDIETKNLSQIAQAEIDYYNIQPQEIEDSQDPIQQRYNQNFEVQTPEATPQEEPDTTKAKPKFNTNYKDNPQQKYNQDFDIESFGQDLQDEPENNSDKTQVSEDYQDPVRQRYNQNFAIQNPELILQAKLETKKAHTKENEDCHENPQQEYNQNFETQTPELNPKLGFEHYSNAQHQEIEDYQEAPRQEYSNNFEVQNPGLSPQIGLEHYNNAQHQESEDYQEAPRQEYSNNFEVQNPGLSPQVGLEDYNNAQHQESNEYQETPQQEYNQNFNTQKPKLTPQMKPEYNSSEQPHAQVQNYETQVSEDELDYYNYSQPQAAQGYPGTTQQEFEEIDEALDEEELNFYNYDQPQENEVYQNIPQQEEIHSYDNEQYQQESSSGDDVNIEELSIDDEDSDDFSLDFYEQAKGEPDESENEGYDHDSYYDDDEYNESHYEDSEDDEDIDEEDQSQDYENEPLNDLSNDEDIESLYTAKKPEAQEVEEEDEDDSEEDSEDVLVEIGGKDFSGVNHNIPIYSPDEDDTSSDEEHTTFEKGDKVKHQQYGVGVVEKVFKHDGKKFYKFNFKTVGIKVLDPSYSPMEKL